MTLRPYDDAFQSLADQFAPSGVGTYNPYRGMTFKDFVFDVFIKSFPGKNFDTWHVHYICDTIDDCFNRGRNACIVIPRLHLKSTLCGHATTIWRMVCSEDKDVSCLYLSYKDGLAKYHAEEIKKVIDNNPLLGRVLTDASPQSVTANRYRVAGGGSARLMTGGIFSFKRGIHVAGVVLADDILRDPQSPLSIGQLLSVEHHVNNEIMHIPNKGTPLIIMGTPMHRADILLKTRENPEFEWVFLPAYGPTESKNYHVLWPSMYDDDYLQAQSTRAGWRAFQTEFMLQPVSEVDAYITRDEIDPLLAIDAYNYPLGVDRPLEPGEVEVFAGYDVGKKRHPSHLMVYSRKQLSEDPEDYVLHPIHQSFHDGVDYEIQAELLIQAIEDFKISKLYVDNSRAEMDERGLPSQCRLVTLSSKVKKEAAAALSQVVSLRRIKFFEEARYMSQLLSVNSALQAPETSLGHGESFFSTMLAVYAHHEAWNFVGISTVNLGEAWFTPTPGAQVQIMPEDLHCRSCGSGVFAFELAGGYWPGPEGADKMKCMDCRDLQPVPEGLADNVPSTNSLRMFAPSAFNPGPSNDEFKVF